MVLAATGVHVWQCNQSTEVRTASIKLFTNTNRCRDGMPNEMPVNRIFKVLGWPCIPGTTNRRCPRDPFARMRRLVCNTSLAAARCNTIPSQSSSIERPHSNAAGPRKLKAQRPSAPCDGIEGARPRCKMECRTPKRLACTKFTSAAIAQKGSRPSTYQCAICL